MIAYADDSFASIIGLIEYFLLRVYLSIILKADLLLERLTVMFVSFYFLFH